MVSAYFIDYLTLIMVAVGGLFAGLIIGVFLNQIYKRLDLLTIEIRDMKELLVKKTKKK
jgi:hypothetical protein